VEKSGGGRKKKTNPKKREPEKDLTTDVPAKRVKTDGSKSVGRLAAKGRGDNHPKKVGGSKPLEPTKSTQLPEPSKNSKPDNKKRKQLDEPELAEGSRHAKRMKKTDPPTKVVRPKPATPKSVHSISLTSCASNLEHQSGLRERERIRLPPLSLQPGSGE
jgi:hypothetical protein